MKGKIVMSENKRATTIWLLHGGWANPISIETGKPDKNYKRQRVAPTNDGILRTLGNCLWNAASNGEYKYYLLDRENPLNPEMGCIAESLDGIEGDCVSMEIRFKRFDNHKEWNGGEKRL